jgi:hypothetical protein
LIEELDEYGVTILDSILEYPPFRKFVHMMDIAGVKIEIWPPAASTTDYAGETIK